MKNLPTRRHQNGNVKNEVSMPLYGVVSHFGFDLPLNGKQSKDLKVITAIVVLENLYHEGGVDLLSDTLEVITKAFRLPNSGEVDVVAYKQGQFIQAVGNLLSWNELKPARAVKLLKGKCNAAAMYQVASKKSGGNRRGNGSTVQVLYHNLALAA